MRGYLRSQCCPGVTLLKLLRRHMDATFTHAMTSPLGKRLVAHKFNHLCMKKGLEGHLKLEGKQHMKLVDQMGQD